MLTPWTERPLAMLLEAHGLAGVAEAPFPNDGWSGASLTRLVRPRDGYSFILKRTSWATDWIARSTRDHALREGFVASMPMPLADPLVAPYHGAAADGTSVAILMPDLSAQLLGWERPASEPSIAVASVERVLQAMARLHAMPWPIADVPDATLVWPSAPLRERLLLLSPRSSARLAADGVAAGERFLTGWAAFNRFASRAARDLVERLDGDPEPLLTALDGLPRTGIHGDLKLANVAFLDDGRVALIDWQMTALAPVAVELGWLLVSNSAALPERPEAILERYRRAVAAVAGSAVGAVAPFDASLAFPLVALQAVIGGETEPRFRSLERTLGDWDAQVDLSWIVGLLLRGWRKGQDAEAGAILASGVSAADDLACWSERAVEAATRRL
ncbi:MAG: phosphotransferase [Candidatus Limnocylindrales bacterium]|nr:phosphotransferase [Candidatus Limnocylindrales bacterium]